MTRVAGGAIGLAAVYALTLASLDPLDLVTGMLVGAILMVALGDHVRPAPEGIAVSAAQRVLWLPLLVGAALADIVQGTWDVALRVMHLRPLSRPGVVRVPIGERSERAIAVSALVTTLSPGSVLVDIDVERGDLLLHVIDASDPDAVRDRLQRFYDRYQRRVFP